MPRGIEWSLPDLMDTKIALNKLELRCSMVSKEEARVEEINGDNPPNYLTKK